MFNYDVFKVERKEKEVILGLKINTLDNITKIKLPTENNLELSAGDSLMVVGFGEGLILVKAIPEAPIAKAKWNVRDNSINSQSIVKNIKKFLAIDKEVTDFNLDVTEISTEDGINGLVLSLPVDDIPTKEEIEEEIDMEENPEGEFPQSEQGSF